MGIGHNFVKNRFVLATDYGKNLIIDDRSGKTVQFIPATVYDNKVLMESDPTYVRRLESLPEAQRKAFLYGDWDAFEGMAFPMWNPKYHVVEPFKIPRHWKKWIAADNGYSDPFAWIWFALSEDGTIYIYREYTRSRDDVQVIYSKQAYNVREKCGYIDEDTLEFKEENIDIMVLGHDASAKPSYTKGANNPEGKSLIDHYMEGFEMYAQDHGLNPQFISYTTAITDRRLRKAVMSEYLELNWDGVSRDDDGLKIKKCKIKIFSTCKNLIELLPQQVNDSDDPEKVDDKTDIEHIYDGVTYGIMYHHAEYSKAPKANKTPTQIAKEQIIKQQKLRSRSMQYE